MEKHCRLSLPKIHFRDFFGNRLGVSRGTENRTDFLFTHDRTCRERRSKTSAPISSSPPKVSKTMVGLPASNRNCHHAMFEFRIIENTLKKISLFYGSIKNLPKNIEIPRQYVKLLKGKIKKYKTKQTKKTKKTSPPYIKYYQ